MIVQTYYSSWRHEIEVQSLSTIIEHSIRAQHAKLYEFRCLGWG